MLREKSKKKVLVTLCDESHVDMAKALFSSAYFHGGWDGDYLLLAHQVPEEKLKWFEEKSIKIWRCQPLSENSKIKSRWKPVFLSKLYIFDCRIKRWDNVVYLDADCMVRSSIKKLGKVKGLKARKVMKTFGHSGLDVNISPKFHFNTGVLAFDTNMVKENTFEEIKNLIPKFMAEARSENHVIITDEIVLARYFKNVWKNFSLIYHVIPDQMKEFCFVPHHKLKGAILHHVGSFMDSVKPWNKDSYFYPEWQENFSKADQVDIEKPIKAESLLAPFYNILVYYDWGKSFFSIKNFSLKIDRLIGELGLVIKKINPQIYYFLKKHFENAK